MIARAISPEYSYCTNIRVQENADWIMNQIENYFLKIGATLKKRKQFSIKAEVAHPDGFVVYVSVKIYADEKGDGNVVDIRRRSGDALLFGIVYQQLLAYDFGRGNSPKMFFDGQICPRIIVKALPSPPSTLLPPFRLDANGEKRTFSNDLEA